MNFWIISTFLTVLYVYIYKIAIYQHFNYIFKLNTILFYWIKFKNRIKMLIDCNIIYIYIHTKMSKLWILFRKSFPEFHDARTFQPFYLTYLFPYYNIIIKLVLHIIVSHIYLIICNGLGHNQHTHIHFSGLLDLSNLYHHNKILLYGYQKINFPPSINNSPWKYPSDNIYGPFL